jgi:hypothetical protein
MPTRREYLSGLTPPLAKAKSRGRLSKVAVAEIARAKESGMTFSDDKEGSSSEDPSTPPMPIVYPKVKSYPQVRKIKAVTGYTPEGALVSSGICFRCAMHVSRCPCAAGITASPIVARWSKESERYGAPIDSTTTS